MNRYSKQFGFSLTEVLIATGIMAIGMVMVATIFPVGVKLTTLTTERTIGAVVADEAFAKIQLYGLRDFQYWPTALNTGDPNVTYVTCNDFEYAYRYDMGPDGLPGTLDDIDIDLTDDFRYPSTEVPVGQEQSYYWSALCRQVGPKDVQVTVFVNRKISEGTQFHAWDWMAVGSGAMTSDWPKPVPVKVRFIYSDTLPIQNKQLVLVNPQPGWGPPAGFDYDVCKQFFDDGCTIVDRKGRIYRVLEVDHVTGTLTLQQDWEWFGYPTPVSDGHWEIPTIWVVPPAVGSDRYPCVGVYQKVIRFDEIQ